MKKYKNDIFPSLDSLEEAEERYNSRDSRPEDLELIEQLRDGILEREERMKALVVSITLAQTPALPSTL